MSEFPRPVEGGNSGDGSVQTSESLPNQKAYRPQLQAELSEG